MDRKVRDKIPELTCQLLKALYPLRQVPAGPRVLLPVSGKERLQGRVEVCIPALRPYEGEVCCRKPPEGGEQGGCQRDVLPGIVQDTQIRQDRSHLGGLKITRAGA